jgi:hypothetical protein
MQTVRKWVPHWRAGGEIALLDRSSRLARLRGTPAARIAEIELLRRQRMSSPAIARQLGMPNSTVTKVLRRLGLNRLKAIDPADAGRALPAGAPGRAVALDTKKAGTDRGHRPSHHRTPHRRDRSQSRRCTDI